MGSYIERFNLQMRVGKEISFQKSSHFEMMLKMELAIGQHQF